jgi:NAD(P)-dependent dehydrogenase (short-subunit alcohol dehydrogenase family)
VTPPFPSKDPGPAKGPLEGRVALVTGGGGGVGRAAALELARAGADVVVLGRSDAPLVETARLVRALGRRAAVARADVADRGGVGSAVAVAERETGPVTILVNAAGIAEAAPLLPPDDALFDRTMATNVRGPWVVSTACLSSMRIAKYGRIVNVASTAALEGARYTEAYVASKHALLGLTRAMALDVAKDGITVNAVCPGFLDTAMTGRTLAKIVASTGRTREQAVTDVLATARQSRLIRPEEVADAILLLVLDSSTTGAAVELRS